MLVLVALLVFGCAEDTTKVDWDVIEERTRVIGVLICDDCSEADIEILVTNENTSEDDVSTLTVYPGKRFSRKIYFDSDWVSVDISIKEVR